MHLADRPLHTTWAILKRTRANGRGILDPKSVLAPGCRVLSRALSTQGCPAGASSSTRSISTAPDNKVGHALASSFYARSSSWASLRPDELVSRVMQLRRTLPVDLVLDEMETIRPVASKELGKQLMLAVMADDVFTPRDVQRIAAALGVDPHDAAHWGLAFATALRHAGIQAAREVYAYVQAQPRIFGPSATNSMVMAVVAQPESAFMNPAHVDLAAAIYRAQLWTANEGWLDPEPVVRALACTIGVEHRWRTISEILDSVPMQGRRRPPSMTPERLALLKSIYVARSHAEAVGALVRNHPELKTVDQLTAAFSEVAHLRFDDARTMPYADFVAFIVHLRSLSLAVVPAVFVAYISAICRVNLRWEPDTAQERETASECLRRVEIPLSNARYRTLKKHEIYTALLRGYSLVGSTQGATRCWDWLLAHPPISPRALAVALTAASTADDVQRVWDGYLASGTTPTPAAWSALARQYCKVGRTDDAFEIVRNKVGDDPAEPAGAVALFARAGSEEALLRYATALPRTWGSARVQALVNKVCQDILFSGVHGVGIIDTD